MDTPDYLHRRLSAYEEQRRAAEQVEQRRLDAIARGRAVRAERNRIATLHMRETARFLAAALIKHEISPPTISIDQGRFTRKSLPLLSGWSINPEYEPAKMAVTEEISDPNSSWPRSETRELAPEESSYASGIILGQDGVAHVYRVAPVNRRRRNRLVIPYGQRQAPQLDGNGNLSFQAELMPDKAKARLLTPQIVLDGLVQLTDVYFQPNAQGALVPRPQPLQP